MPRSIRRANGIGTGTAHHSPLHSCRNEGSASRTRVHCSARRSPSCSPQLRSCPCFRVRTASRQPPPCAPSRTTAVKGHNAPAHAVHAYGGHCRGAFTEWSVAPQRRHQDPSASTEGTRVGRMDANSSRSISAPRCSQRRAARMNDTVQPRTHRDRFPPRIPL